MSVCWTQNGFAILKPFSMFDKRKRKNEHGYAGVRELQDGQTVEYDLMTGKDGRICAENLQIH